VLFHSPVQWGRRLFHRWLLADLRVEGYSLIVGLLMFVAGFFLESWADKQTVAGSHIKSK